MLTAEQILAIEKVGDLFTNDKDKLKAEYIKLTKIWHPDISKDPLANDVMSKINDLYNKALSLIEEAKWEGSNFIKLSCKNKKTIQFKFRTSFNFELGRCFISDNILVYLLEGKYKQYYDNGIKNIKSFKYPSDKMKDEMSKYLPVILEEFETNDGQLGLILKKTPDLLLLKDVLKYYGNNIPDKHVAWILSSLYNITCYLDYLGVSHNGVSLNNYFISPVYHSGALLGGWWYATKQGEKMIGVPKEIYGVLPPKTKDSKLSNITTDLEAVRYIGNNLLGGNVKFNKTIPKGFIEWLMAGSSKKASEEYGKWQKALENIYGKRKFIVMDLTADKLYK